MKVDSPRSRVDKEIKPKSKRGGARPGAGRKPKNASFETSRITDGSARVYLTNIEPRKEVTPWDRRTLMEAGRWSVNNHGMAARIVRGTARFAVGNGLVPQAQTGDFAWNREAEMWFEDRYCNVPWAFDKAGQFDFYTAQTALIESMLTDGEVYAQLVKSEAGAAKNSNFFHRPPSFYLRGLDGMRSRRKRPVATR